MNRKTVSILLASVLLSGGLLLSSVTYANTLTQKQQQASNLKQQEKSTKSKINSLASRELSLEKQIENLQSQLGTLQSQINRNQAEIAQRNQEISQLKSKIAATQKQLNAQYKLLQQRLQIMYEDGNTSYLQVLFSSTSFSDLLNRFQLLTTIAQADNNMLKSIQTTKDNLAQQTGTLEQQQKEQQQIYDDLVAKQDQQKQKQGQEEQLLTQVHSAKLSAQADLQQENAALSELTNEISQLEAAQGAYSGPVSGWTWPVPAVHSISSGYGERILWGQQEFHPGVDIPGGAGGETIVAATAGRVLYAGAASGYGLWIVVQSGGGLVEVYGHVNDIRVYPGEAVSEGEPIAIIGSGIEGRSTGPHLHFQIGRGGVTSAESIDPLKYVSP